jgi:putative DNA primase/helicase
LAALTPHALSASNISPSSVFRTVDKWGPTLLVDEADSFARDNDELRGILNCGHDRSGAFVIRTVGDSHEPKQFCTWAPKAIAMIGKLPVTWQSRSIHIALKRMFPGDYVDPLRQGKTRHLDPLKRKAARWAVDHVNDLRAADPQIPESLYGRAADNWRPLIAIADLAGGDWPDRGRRVAEKFGGRREDLAPIQALEDIAAMFVTKGEKVIKSEEVVAALIKMEHRPWPEWKKEKPITTRQLAALLEPFEIAPKQHWVEGENRRGYHVDQFEDARQRYFGGEHTLPKTPSGGTFAARPLDPAENSHFSDPLAARGDEFLADHPLGGDGVLADRPSKKPQKPKASSGIADKKPEKGILGDSDPFATLKDQRLRLQPEVEMPDLPDFLDRRGR